MDVSRALSPAWNWMVEHALPPIRLRMWLSLGFGHLLQEAEAERKWRRQLGKLGRSTAWPRISGRRIRMVVSHVAVLIAVSWSCSPSSLLISWLVSVFNFVFIDDTARKSGAIAEPLRV